MSSHASDSISVRRLFLDHGYEGALLERVASEKTTIITRAPYIGRDYQISPSRYVEDRATWDRRCFPLADLIAAGETRAVQMARTGESGQLRRSDDGLSVWLDSDDGSFSERYANALGIEHLLTLLVAFDAQISASGERK